MSAKFVISIAFLLCSIGGAQPLPAFEVAVIKPVEAAGPAPARMNVTSQQVTAALTLRRLIELAYQVSTAQIEGPDWLMRPGSEPMPVYSIDTKVPEGSTPAQVPLMLQRLLEDRFQLRARKGSKLIDSYALTVAKGGIKFPKHVPVAGEPDGFSLLNFGVSSGGDAKAGSVLRISGAATMPGPNGSIRIQASTSRAFVEFVARLLGPEPGVDKTGLEGLYDIQMDVPGADIHTQAEMRGDYFPAIEKLGLKLELGKNAIDTIVIEHLEKAPSEN